MSDFKKLRVWRSAHGYALASTSELENHLIVAHDIRVVTESDYRSLLAQLADVRKMLHGLMTRLADSSSSTISSVSAKGDKRPLKRTVPRLAADRDQRSAGGG